MKPQKEQFLEMFEKIDFPMIKDHPNILIAASFWEPERYDAAKSCYKFMRAIDDMIDNHKAENKFISDDLKKSFLTNVDDWLNIVVSDEYDPPKIELIETIKKFRIPIWTLEDFARSMVYDINNDGFPTLQSFIEYSKGASVAPASIFVHLNSLKKVNNHFENPRFDVRWASTPCAIFSYLVHIIRDFQKDQLSNLTYFADDLVIKNNLTRKDLREFAEGRPVNADFRNLISLLYRLADEHRIRTIEVLREIRPILRPRYQLSLDIIFNLYLMVFEKIDIEKGNFSTEELHSTPEETRKRVYETIMNFN